MGRLKGRSLTLVAMPVERGGREKGVIFRQRTRPWVILTPQPFSLLPEALLLAQSEESIMLAKGRDTTGHAPHAWTTTAPAPKGG